MIRQGTFIAKMHAFGWTAPGYFDSAADATALAHAITRYHAYVPPPLFTHTPARTRLTAMTPRA